MSAPTSSATERASLLENLISRRYNDNGPEQTSHEVNAQANGHAVDGEFQRQGNGRPLLPNPIPTYRPPLQDRSLLPDGKHSLSGISAIAAGLGTALGISLMGILVLALDDNPLWRAPFFVAALATFHFLEFWVTAQHNTALATPDAFLLTANGMAYNLAHVSALLETILVQGRYTNWGLKPKGRDWFLNFLPFNSSWSWPFSTLPVAETTRTWQDCLVDSLPGSKWRHWGLIAGLGLVLLGQATRSMAMRTAGRNFNHTVQTYRRQEHELVTHGVYAYLRHPSYFGFFWWAIGTQLVLGNRFCLLVYAIVLWAFFKDRIYKEEEFLTRFFGKEYIEYKRRTGVGIPGIG